MLNNFMWGSYISDIFSKINISVILFVLCAHIGLECNANPIGSIIKILKIMLVKYGRFSSCVVPGAARELFYFTCI